MKIYPIDFLLINLAMLVLGALSLLTAWALSLDNAYHVLLDLAVFLLAYGAYTALLLALVRKFKPYPVGQFSMDSLEFTYWKVAAVLTSVAEKALGPFTNVMSQAAINSLLGAHVGKNVAFGGVLRDYPLLHFDEYSTVGQSSVITAHLITHDHILMQPVHISRNAVVGVNCTVMPGVTLGENAVLVAGSVATVGMQIPANEMWGGSPARKLKNLTPPA
jgi:acetyltransferase-like isoleucine patch superfamily enzyme